MNSESVKIIINMFEFVSCCVVSFQTDHSRHARPQRETAVLWKRLEASTQETRVLVLVLPDSTGLYDSLVPGPQLPISAV